jgi:hypothetical protein
MGCGQALVFQHELDCQQVQTCAHKQMACRQEVIRKVSCTQGCLVVNTVKSHVHRDSMLLTSISLVRTHHILSTWNRLCTGHDLLTCPRCLCRATEINHSNRGHFLSTGDPVLSTSIAPVSTRKDCHTSLQSLLQTTSSTTTQIHDKHSIIRHA